MKIAVTSTGTDLDAQADQRFGRAAYILIVDSDTLDFEVLDNKENANALKGAGIKTATTVGNKGANVLLTGFCGPNAFKTLKAAKIGIASGAEGTVKDVVKDYLNGKLPLSDEPNAQGHW